MKRIVLFLCVLVFSIFSNTNNLLAKEIENNIKDNISNEIEEIKPDNKKTNISNSSVVDLCFLLNNRLFVQQTNH